MKKKTLYKILIIMFDNEMELKKISKERKAANEIHARFFMEFCASSCMDYFMEQENIFVVTFSPEYSEHAFKELKDLDQGLKFLSQYESGIMLVKPSMEKRSFNQAIIDKKPIFIRHINSVDYVVDINPEIDLNIIISAIKNYKNEVAEGDILGVQVRKAKGEYSISSVDIKQAIDKAVADEFGSVSQVKEPEKIISILLVADKCYIGLSRAEENLSTWSGGMVHYKKSEDDISRAKFKLMEAIYVFGIDMSEFHNALDLGAAPGGWTSVLLEYGINVTAVDTGDMDERLFKNQNFRYIKANAAELKLDEEAYDLLTCDMSWNAMHTAKMVNKSAESLQKGGTAIVTVKLMSDKIWKAIKNVMKVYEEAFEILWAKQLFHNRDEITLLMRKR